MIRVSTDATKVETVLVCSLDRLLPYRRTIFFEIPSSVVYEVGISRNTELEFLFAASFYLFFGYRAILREPSVVNLHLS